MHKVSIIIPVYNSEKYISKCLDSVLNQTYKNIEVLVINDGSKDESINILKEYEKKDNRIILVDKGNEGVAKTRNKGIKLSKGDYIMFIDNDDYIDSDYVETYVNEILNCNYDIVIGGYRRENDNDKLISKQILNNSEWSKYIVLAPWAKLYKKEFLLNNEIEFLSYGIGEDVYFNLLAYSKNPKIKIIDSVKYIWYFNNKSVSNTNQKGLKKEIDIFFLLDKIVSFVNMNDKNVNYFFERYIVWYLLFSGRQASKKQFKQLYKDAQTWLEHNHVKRNVKLFKIKGEVFKVKITVIMFRIIGKFHLINLFALLYCRGDDND